MSVRGGVVAVARWLWLEQLALALAALVVAAGEVLAIHAVYWAAFGPTRRISPASDLPLGHAVLWGFGLAGAFLSLVSAYRLLRYGRIWLAVPLVLLVSFPVMVVSLGSLYASLIVSSLL